MQAHAFAELAGVSVRTLHHYDRLGLLKPAKRTPAGYRQYCLEDLERIEQIVALKFLGLSLADISRVLREEPLSLAGELSRQRAALLEKRRLLDRALAAIDEAQLGIERGESHDKLLRRIIEVIQMHNDSNWMMKYYSPEAQAKLAERAKTLTLEMQAEVGKAWKDYYRDLAALKDQTDPDGAKAAELSRRHAELLAQFTGNDPEIEAGLTAFYRDRANWPSEMKDLISDYERG